MIFNGSFDPALVEYDGAYDNTLSYSGVFHAYAANLAERLVATHDLRGKDIVEIGCGSGDFLNQLSTLGKNRCTGFDPSAENRNVPGLPTVVSRRFTVADAALGADFVCSRHVLEHLDAPCDLLGVVRQCLLERGGKLYFEVPDARWVLEGPSTWDLIYPHCSYFTAESLQYLFEKCGFDVTNVQASFGGQFLGIEARVSSRTRPVTPDPRTMAATARIAESFDAKLRNSIHRWARFIEYASIEGRRLALWGGGTKGVTFLNVVSGADRIGVVVDLNPRKQGTFVPGTAQPVIAPEKLPEYRSDIVIILNPLYEREIREALSLLGLDAVVTLDAELPLAKENRTDRALGVASSLRWTYSR